MSARLSAAISNNYDKLAVVFPGVGYHTDKPLLYYSKKLAVAQGYRTIDVNYGGFETGIKGNPEKMQKAFESALEQSEMILQDIDFAKYKTILFISKSIGTVVAAVYGARHDLQTYHIAYTPVEQTFSYMEQPCIYFHGTSDPWLSNSIFLRECERTDSPFHLTEGGNHSLETGQVAVDLSNLQRIMCQTEEYMAQCGNA